MIRLRSLLPLSSLLTLGLALSTTAHAQQAWIAPTPEELQMTSIKEVPGADAVILNRDELDDDDNHKESIYSRIKILTEKGVHLGDVELPYDKRNDENGNSIDGIEGRTIQPDGAIIPFTGKPYDKVLEKRGENNFKARVFSLPAVKVGSIIEYRYSIRWDDHRFFAPDWIIQGDLYLRKAHYLWKPTDKELHGVRRGGRESFSERVAWAKSLPEGTDLKVVTLPTGRLKMEVNVADVMPFLNEEYMPPIRSSRFHVFFYYSPYYSVQDFWDTEIKYWNSDTNKFENQSDLVRQEASKAIAGATTDDEKARKLYAYVMTLENTDYTRKRTSEEEKAEIKNADDVLKRKHGTSDQITMTYVALARAARLDAAAMAISDRSTLMFDPTWQDFGAQLTEEIAVVKYGNQDHFLDPGSRYTPFGHLEWNHTMTNGVRQDNADKTKMFLNTPADGYKFSHTSRVADLKLEADGHMTGSITLTYEGSPALRWRHVALRTDENELRNRLKKELESWMPGDTNVEVKTIAGIDDSETPLKLTATVDGHIGNAVGSRVMLPSDVFEANKRPALPHEKRDQAVYMPYPETTQDVVRYKLPAGFTVESTPTSEPVKFQGVAVYTMKSTQTLDSVTMRRDLILGEIYFPLKDYPELRTFYKQFEASDHGSVVLKRSTEKAAVETPSTH